MVDTICMDCGYKDNINMFDIDACETCDPNPVISCPKCGGCCEDYEED